LDLIWGKARIGDKKMDHTKLDKNPQHPSCLSFTGARSSSNKEQQQHESLDVKIGEKKEGPTPSCRAGRGNGSLVQGRAKIQRVIVT